MYFYSCSRLLSKVSWFHSISNRTTFRLCYLNFCNFIHLPSTLSKIVQIILNLDIRILSLAQISSTHKATKTSTRTRITFITNSIPSTLSFQLINKNPTNNRLQIYNTLKTNNILKTSIIKKTCNIRCNKTLWTNSFILSRSHTNPGNLNNSLNSSNSLLLLIINKLLTRRTIFKVVNIAWYKINNNKTFKHHICLLSHKS